MRLLTSNYNSSGPSGHASVSTDGSYTVVVWNGSGSYTA
jgi:hypothetical protein